MRKIFFLIIFPSFLFSYPLKTLPSKKSEICLKKDIRIRKKFLKFNSNKIKKIIEFKEIYGNQNLKGKNDTAKIYVLGIRVGFKKEEPDDPLTTGNGWFNLKGNADSIKDTNSLFYEPPHDKKYFENSLEALKAYISAISYGKIKIEYVVKPDKNDSFYILPYPMRYYGDTSNFDIGLIKLFKDALFLADNDESIKFNDLNNNGIKDYVEGIKDVIIIFHAGSTWQTDIFWDTPFDIATVTIPQGAIEYYLGSPYILLNNQKDTVAGGIILPETGSQDGFFAKLQGLLFHEFGHDAFYLTDLYNIYGYSTGVGAWDLMGSGGWAEILEKTPDGDTARISGIIPSFYGGWTRLWIDYMMRYMPKRYFDPDAWEIYDPLWGFGFLDNLIDTIYGSGFDSIIKIYPSNPYVNDTVNYLPDTIYGIRLLMIPIDSREYFLCEFRKSLYDNLKYFKKGGVLISPYGNYDFVLPGFGLLIWHVDENIVYNYYWEVNSNEIHKGVDVEEADCIQDLDKWTEYPYTWFGSKYDVFYEGNNDKFGIFTCPSSESYNKGKSFIEIKEIGSSSNEFISFRYKRDIYLKPFPIICDIPFRDSGNYFDETFINFLDIDNDGNGEFILIGKKTFNFYGEEIGGGRIYVLKNDGTNYGNNPYIKFQKEEILFPPAFYDFNNDGIYEIVIATDKYLRVYSLTKPSPQNFPGFPLYFSKITSPPLIYNFIETNEIIFSCEDGNTYILNPLNLDFKKIFTNSPGKGLAILEEGNEKYLVILNENGILNLIDKELKQKEGFPCLYPTLLNTYSLPVVCDFDSDKEYEIGILRGDGKFYIVNSKGEIEGEKNLKEGRFSSLSVVDFDKDGFYEIAFLKDDSLILLNHNGSFVNEFPLKIKRDKNLSPYSIPLTFYLNKKISISYPDSLKFSHIYEDLKSNPYFPLHILNNGNAILTDANNDGKYEISAFSKLCEIHVFNINADSVIFPKIGYDNQNTSFYKKILIPIQREEKEKVYIYPSIVKGNNATLRAFFENSGYLKLELWTFSGIKLKSYKYYIKGNEFNEFDIDFKEEKSGIYILRWEFGKKKGFFKFSILK
jgi:M6 family metalloprotease-like protein